MVRQETVSYRWSGCVHSARIFLLAGSPADCRKRTSHVSVSAGGLLATVAGPEPWGTRRSCPRGIRVDTGDHSGAERRGASCTGGRIPTIGR